MERRSKGQGEGQEAKPKRMSRGRRAAALAASALAGLGVGVGGARATAETQPSAAERAAHEITVDISLGHGLNVLTGGTAVVQFENGTQLNIENPILEGNAVAERTRGENAGEGDAVTTYVNGADHVASIAYFEADLHADGTESSEEALAQTTAVQLERPDGLSGPGDPYAEGGANFFVAADNPNMHIAQGTLYEGQK